MSAKQQLLKLTEEFVTPDINRNPGDSLFLLEFYSPDGKSQDGKKINYAWVYASSEEEAIENTKSALGGVFGELITCEEQAEIFPLNVSGDAEIFVVHPKQASQQSNQPTAESAEVQLKEPWISKVVSMNESGMGYTLVDITLKNGRVLESVPVLNCEFCQTAEQFSSDDIAGIAKH